MALRYALPSGCGMAGPREELRRAPALRPAAVVEYRARASLRPFVAEVMAKPLCKVVGETGCGKSTVVPKLLAHYTDRTVFCVTAHPLLAYSGHKFFSANPTYGFSADGLRGTLLRTEADEVEVGSVVWSGAAVFVAWLAARLDRDGGPLRNCIVVLDEAHECDAYTHVVRSLALALGAANLVMMSATFDADVVSRGKEKVVASTYPGRLKAHSWDVNDSTKPWSFARIRECAAIFVDSSTAADHLRQSYTRIGCDVFRLTSRSSEREFDRAVAATLDQRGAVAVLLLDSSYRSGFNFDVSDVIDTGEVYYVDDDLSRLRYNSRQMYHGECVQTMGRGGRFSQVVRYSRPEGELELKLCHLLPAEAEAAAFLFRCLGFQPVGELAAVYMAHDDLPYDQDAVAALAGVYPLPHYTRTSSGVRRHGVRSVTPPVKRPSPMSGTSAVRSASTRVEDTESRLVPASAAGERGCMAWARGVAAPVSYARTVDSDGWSIPSSGSPPPAGQAGASARWVAPVRSGGSSQRPPGLGGGDHVPGGIEPRGGELVLLARPGHGRSAALQIVHEHGDGSRPTEGLSGAFTVQLRALDGATEPLRAQLAARGGRSGRDAGGTGASIAPQSRAAVGRDGPHGATLSDAAVARVAGGLEGVAQSIDRLTDTMARQPVAAAEQNTQALVRREPSQPAAVDEPNSAAGAAGARGGVGGNWPPVAQVGVGYPYGFAVAGTPLLGFGGVAAWSAYYPFAGAYDYSRGYGGPDGG